MKRIKTFILVATIFLVSITSTLSEIIKFGVTATLLNGGYWLRTIILNVSAIIVLFLANSMRKDKLMSENDTVYAERKKILKDSFEKIDDMGLAGELKNYIDEDNRKEKLRVYTNKLKARLKRVDSAILRAEHNYNVFRLCFKKPPVETPKTLFLLLSRNKKKRLEDKLLNAERDIEFIYVRYTKIKYSALFGESEKIKSQERDIYFHTTEHNIGIVLKKAIFILLMGTLSSLQVGELTSNFNLFTVYQMCMRMFTLALSIYTGIADADYFVLKHMADVLFKRMRYVQDFLKSKK